MKECQCSEVPLPDLEGELDPNIVDAEKLEEMLEEYALRDVFFGVHDEEQHIDNNTGPDDTQSHTPNLGVGAAIDSSKGSWEEHQNLIIVSFIICIIAIAALAMRSR